MIHAETACADALRNLKTSIADANAVVRVDPLPHVLADPTQLTQVFQNLIGNGDQARLPDVSTAPHDRGLLGHGYWVGALPQNY